MSEIITLKIAAKNIHEVFIKEIAIAPSLFLQNMQLTSSYNTHTAQYLTTEQQPDNVTLSINRV